MGDFALDVDGVAYLEGLAEAALRVDKEEVLYDLWPVEEAEGEALGEEAWGDALAKGSSSCLLLIEEEGVADAYHLDEGVDFFGGECVGWGLEGLADLVVLVVPHEDARIHACVSSLLVAV